MISEKRIWSEQLWTNFRPDALWWGHGPWRKMPHVDRACRRCGARPARGHRMCGPPVDRKWRGLRVDDHWRGAEAMGNTSSKWRVREGGVMMRQWKWTEAATFDGGNDPTVDWSGGERDEALIEKGDERQLLGELRQRLVALDVRNWLSGITEVWGKRWRARLWGRECRRETCHVVAVCRVLSDRGFNREKGPRRCPRGEGRKRWGWGLVLVTTSGGVFWRLWPVSGGACRRPSSSRRTAIGGVEQGWGSHAGGARYMERHVGRSGKNRRAPEWARPNLIFYPFLLTRLSLFCFKVIFPSSKFLK
jgi:hypothetical protein